VAVISYRYWQKRFSGRSDIVGKQINLNNVAFTIAGVAPPVLKAQWTSVRQWMSRFRWDGRRWSMVIVLSSWRR